MKIQLESGTIPLGGLAAGFLAVLTLTACATSHVLVGARRPAISPDQVHLYLQAPTKYEEVALLSSSSRGSFAVTEQGRSDAVLERLRKEAASLGANGILLQGVSDQAAGSVGSGWATGSNVSSKTGHAIGFGASSSIFMKSGTGIAIYVPPDAAAAR